MDTTQTPLYFILATVFFVIGTIIFCFVVSIINQQRYVRCLHQSKIEAEITTLEAERKRIAEDIHDELGPLLSAAKLKFNQLEYYSDDDQLLLQKGNLYLEDIMAKMRDIARNLMPAVLLYKGTVIAILEFIAHTVETNELAIIFDPSEIPELSHFQSLHTYRIIQEIIHNTLKHADADRLKIVIYAKKDELIISTIDDGKGFNYKNTYAKGRGFGLYNIQSRVDILHGNLQVKSAIGKGVKYYITIPL